MRTEDEEEKKREPRSASTFIGLLENEESAKENEKKPVR